MVAPPRAAGRVKVTSGGSGGAITRTGASMRRHGRACASRRLSATSRALDRSAHGLEQGALGRQRHLASLAEEVGVARSMP